MIRIFLSTILLLSSLYSRSQLKPPPPPPDPDSVKRLNVCMYTGRFPVEQRRRLYPFSAAKIVKVVSFKSTELNNSIPKKNGEIDYKKLTEIRTLTGDGVDSLSNILYNYSYKNKYSIEQEYMCYWPRNAVLFIDSSGSTFDYLELCFECAGFYSQSGRLTVGDKCTQKFEMLSTFFRKRGIRKGTSPMANL